MADRLRLGRSHKDIVYLQTGDEPSSSDERVAVFMGPDAVGWATVFVALGAQPAGPPEPRTWPKLDGPPEIDDLPRVVDVEGHGRWSRLATHHFYPEADSNGAPLTLAGLRELGQVREVLDGS